MEIVGIGQGSGAEQTGNIATEVKKLLQLQGELVVKLIESAQVPNPGDKSSVPGLGTRLDVHI
jgi:hypothetical protein